MSASTATNENAMVTAQSLESKTGQDSTGKFPWQACDRLICKPGTYFELVPVTINGRQYRIWKNQYPTYRAMMMDKLPKLGSQVFINAPAPDPATGRVEITYEAAYAQALQLAGWLRSQGIVAGDHVALVGYNSIPWAVAFIASHLIGSVPCMINCALTMDSMVHCLNTTHPKLILADAVSAVALAPYRADLAKTGCGELVSWQNLDHLKGPKDVKVLEFESLKSDPKVVDEIIRGTGGGLEGLGPLSDATIFFTSGTTGYPKAALGSQMANMHNFVSAKLPTVRAAVRAGTPVEAAVAAVTNPPAVRSVGLLAIPFFHGTGCCSWLGKAIHDGNQLVLMRRWSVKDACKLILDHKVNVIGGVPSIPIAIMQSGLLPKNYPMKGIAYGGAASPSRLAHDIRDMFPTGSAQQGWGMTEVTVLHCQIAGGDFYAKPKSTGPPAPPCDVRIVDDQNRVLGPGQVGQVQANGPNIMKEYYGNPKATAEAIDSEGWLNTGDAGYLDEDGSLYIADRIKDIIIRGGENISSEEVENAIYLDDRIAEAASVPVPDDYLGELVALAVSLVPGKQATPASIIAAAESRLRRDARPVFVYISDDLLPRNINGKLIKADIKKVVQAAYAEHKKRAKL